MIKISDDRDLVRSLMMPYFSVSVLVGLTLAGNEKYIYRNKKMKFNNEPTLN